MESDHWQDLNHNCVLYSAKATWTTRASSLVYCHEMVEVVGVRLHSDHGYLAINLDLEPFLDDSPLLRSDHLADQIQTDHIRHERQELNMSVLVAYGRLVLSMTVIENGHELPVSRGYFS